VPKEEQDKYKEAEKKAKEEAKKTGKRLKLPPQPQGKKHPPLVREGNQSKI